MTGLVLPHLESLEQQVRTALGANDLGGLRSLLAAHTALSLQRSAQQRAAPDLLRWRFASG